MQPETIWSNMATEAFVRESLSAADSPCATGCRGITGAPGSG